MALSPDGIEGAIRQVFGDRADGLFAAGLKMTPAEEARARAALYSNRAPEGDLGVLARQQLAILSSGGASEQEQMQAAVALSEIMNVMRRSDSWVGAGR